MHQSPDDIQQSVEGQNLSLRLFLHKYESVIEGQRQATQGQAPADPHGRHSMLFRTGEVGAPYHHRRSVGRLPGEITELRAGIHWVTWGNRDPLFEYLNGVHKLFQQLEADIEEETAKRLVDAEAKGLESVSARGHLDLSDDRPAFWQRE